MSLIYYKFVYFGNSLHIYLSNSPVLPEVIVQVLRVVLDAETAGRTLFPPAAVIELPDGGVVADEERPPVAKVRPDHPPRGP